MKIIHSNSFFLLLGFMLLLIPSTAQINNSPIIIVSPEDLTYEYGTSFNTISWIVEDDDPSYYIMSIDGAGYKNETWVSNQEISISVDGLPIGRSILQIIFFDLINQSTFDSVVITTDDTTSPLITRIPDREIRVGTTFNFLRWGAIDSNPNNYTITLDNELFKKGFWISGQSIAIQIDNLVLGTHEFEIIIFDDYLNFANDLVVISVVEFIIPSDTSTSKIISTDDKTQASTNLKFGLLLLLITILIFSVLVFLAKNQN